MDSNASCVPRVCASPRVSPLPIVVADEVVYASPSVEEDAVVVALEELLELKKEELRPCAELDPMAREPLDCVLSPCDIPTRFGDAKNRPSGVVISVVVNPLPLPVT